MIECVRVASNFAPYQRVTLNVKLFMVTYLAVVDLTGNGGGLDLCNDGVGHLEFGYLDFDVSTVKVMSWQLSRCAH